jgi:hypothetical protein
MNGRRCAKRRVRVRHAVPLLRKQQKAKGTMSCVCQVQRSSCVVTWAQAGMPVLLFFIHEGQPIVTIRVAFILGLIFLVATTIPRRLKRAAEKTLRWRGRNDGHSPRRPVVNSSFW